MTNKTNPPELLFHCGNCGWDVRLRTGKGRTREYRKGLFLSIPDDFEIPTCSHCGDTYMSPDISTPLDAILAEQFRQIVKQELENGGLDSKESHSVPKEVKVPEGRVLFDADPNCKHRIVAAWSGIECTKCPGWFCY